MNTKKIILIGAYFPILLLIIMQSLLGKYAEYQIFFWLYYFLFTLPSVYLYFNTIHSKFKAQAKDILISVQLIILYIISFGSPLLVLLSGKSLLNIYILSSIPNGIITLGLILIYSTSRNQINSSVILSPPLIIPLEIKNNSISLIQKGKEIEAINFLIKYFSKEDNKSFNAQLNYFYLIKNRLRNNSNKINKGILSNEEAEIERNKIVNSLIEEISAANNG